MNPEAHFGSTGQVRNIRERCLLLLCPRNSPVTPPHPRYGVEININSLCPSGGDLLIPK